MAKADGLPGLKVVLPVMATILLTMIGWIILAVIGVEETVYENQQDNRERFRSLETGKAEFRAWSEMIDERLERATGRELTRDNSIQGLDSLTADHSAQIKSLTQRIDLGVREIMLLRNKTCGADYGE